MKGKFAVISNNEVQRRLCYLLCEKGYDCDCIDVSDRSFPSDELEKYDNIILPFPSKKENIGLLSEKEKLSDYISQRQTVIGGMIDVEIKDDLEAFDIKYTDYFQSEAYIIKNAYITCQGAMKELLNNTSDYLVGKNVLITGFGRIGKSLALMLKALGLRVCVAARREEVLVDAASLGFDVLKISKLKSTLFYFDYIFNTVPSKIIEDIDIEHLRADATYFELASSPYGADREVFDKLGKKHIPAAALPGKHFPQAVAENIYSFITSVGDD